MTVGEFLLDVFNDSDKVTINANELQTLIREKRSLERTVLAQDKRIQTIETSLTNKDAELNNLHNKLKYLDSKLSGAAPLYHVDLRA